MDKSPFDAGWLALREPVDHRSRSESVLPPLREIWQAAGWRRILDLGSGTGSNVRYLAPRLPGVQEWTLLDDDPALLRRVTLPEPAPSLEPLVGDLAREGLTAVNRADLVTASALLDLVSVEWLARLVEACRSASCGALFALTYDGTIRWALPEGDEEDPTGSSDGAEDRLVEEAVNAHQRRDKGLGPALGPEAGTVGERLFREAGFRTWLLPSPWRLERGDAPLALALIEGWESAAVSERPREMARIRRWAGRRREAVARGAFALLVGHVDLLALPPPR